MAENSKIEWTDHTFNPWIGCQKVSEGCQFCYAEAMMDHRYGRVKWGPNGTRVRTSEANWRKPLQWNRQAEKEGIRRKVFCASLADVFEDRRGQDALTYWRAQLWRLIELTPSLDWLLLTKRPQNILEMLPDKWLYRCSSIEERVDRIPANIWLGTSVEDQAAADERIPHLLKIPAQVRFLSCEPLLGPVDLSEWFIYERRLYGDAHFHEEVPIHWVIAGGESGHRARPMHPDWARSLRDQCRAAGVAFFFKQWGAWAPGGAWAGKQAAGRLLDGAEWNEYPR